MLKSYFLTVNKVLIFAQFGFYTFVIESDLIPYFDFVFSAFGFSAGLVFI